MKKLKKQKNQKGFTLVELMITIAIVGVLAAVAVPMYTSYSGKAAFAGVISQTGAYKAQVSQCLNSVGSSNMSACDAGTEGISLGMSEGTRDVLSIDIVNSVITTTAVSDAPYNSLTYVLTPTVINGVIRWVESGTCKTPPEVC